VKTKARVLYERGEPFLPAFPLDGDTLDELQDYPGDVPRDVHHFLQLLMQSPR
jgi:hypothetical protein